MLHGDKLFFCNDSCDLTLIDDRSASNLTYMSDDTFFYMVTEQKKVDGNHIKHSKVIMIDTLFGSFASTEVY